MRGVPYRVLLMAVVAGSLLPVSLTGCESRTEAPSDGTPPAPTGPETNEKGDVPMSIALTSTAFGPGETIPKKYTGDGEDVSPPLSWTGVPDGAQQLALICDDPDAPTDEPWVHWLLYNIPPDVTSLPEGVPPAERPDQPQGAAQGKNSWPSGRTIGYRGPAPPPGHGVHHYHFKLYALDAELGLEPGLDKPALLKAIDEHILAQGELIGTYER